MRAEGAADAPANPSGHGYLILLDIGGQDQYDGGVVLSATTHFVTYSRPGARPQGLRRRLPQRAAGQRARSRSRIGTNNDMDVSRPAAASVGRPASSTRSRPTPRSYSGMTIAGANDIEPGFRGVLHAVASWLSGLPRRDDGAVRVQRLGRRLRLDGSPTAAATTAGRWPGCTTLAAGAAPTRMLNLPQIYNTTMADAVEVHLADRRRQRAQPRINFGGAADRVDRLRARPAAAAASPAARPGRSCGTNLQSDRRLKVGSLPYSTDLRIDH